MDSPDFTSLDLETLEQQARLDPVLKRVNEELDKIPTIRTLWFLSRINDIYVFVTDMLDVLAAAKTQIVRRKMHGVLELARPCLPGH